MKFSDDRINHIAHLMRDGLRRDGLVSYPDEDKALREVKRVIIDYWKVEDEVDEQVREKIATLKRGVMEGSREWELLYRRYKDEELTKKGR